MPLYLAPFIGDGTSDNPYRAVGLEEQGSGIIDLRPDCTVSTGRALLYAPAAMADTRLTKIGDAILEALKAPTQKAINNALGITLAESRLDRIIAELLMVHGGGSRWKGLRATKQGRYEIWLGALGRIYEQRIVAGGTTLDETWTIGDKSTDIDADLDWTVTTGSLGISGNAVTSQTPLDSDQEARCESDLATDDHYAQVDVTVLPQPTSVGRFINAGVAVRFAAAARTFYGVRILYGQDGSQNLQFIKSVTGTYSALDTNQAVTLSIPDTIKVQADGSTLTSYFNGTLKHNFTDTAIVDNLRAGITGNNRDAHYKVDTWQAADVAAAATVRPRSLLTMGVGQ